MGLAESGEMYLETIYVLTRKSTSVRSIDVAESMGYSKPSVSVAMKKLREDGYIEIDSDGYIDLLPKGKQVAEEMYERHTILTECLQRLGVPSELASVDACKIEHVISAESFEAIKKFMKR